MADLPSTFSYVTDVEVAQDANLTENLHVKLGQNDNFLKDNLDAEIATRAAADSSINSTITTAQVALGVLDGVSKYLTSSTEPVGVEILQTQRYVSVQFVKHTAANTTLMEIRVYKNNTDSFDWIASVDLGISPTTWSTASWYWFSVEDQIAWHLFTELTYVSV